MKSLVFFIDITYSNRLISEHLNCQYTTPPGDFDSRKLIKYIEDMNIPFNCKAICSNCKIRRKIAYHYEYSVNDYLRWTCPIIIYINNLLYLFRK